MDVRVCPICLGQDTTADFPRSVFGIYADRCNSCGFAGTMILMNDEDADKLARESNSPNNQSEPVQSEPVQSKPVDRVPAPSQMDHSSEETGLSNAIEPNPSIYCSHCMQYVQGRKAIFGSKKCEICGEKLDE